MTLIEILIAIGVFSVGILGVLTVISQNIATITTVQTKTMATMLAREGMELVFHIRDTNKVRHIPRFCVKEKEGATLTENESPCEQTFDPTGRDSLLVSFSPLQQAREAKTGTIEHTDFFSQMDLARLYEYTAINKKNENNPFLHWYGHTGQDFIEDFIQEKKIPFARFISFTGLTALPDEDLLSGEIYKVTSTVLYTQGGRTGSLFLESFIGNVE